MKTERFQEAAETYLKSLASLGKSPHTVRLYTTVLRRFGDFLSRLAGEITPATIAAYRSKLSEGDLSANSVRQHLTIIHAFFAKNEAFSRLSGDLDANPVLREEIPEEVPVDYDDVLTAEEIRILLDTKPKATAAGIPLRNYCIIVMLLQTGLRNSELRALTVEDLDFDNHVVNVRHGKGDKQRAAPFPALARETVREYLSSGTRPEGLPDSAPLFGSMSGGEWGEYNLNALNALVKRYTRKIIGREVHCHLLRHAAASSWDDAGIPIRDVQKALGHSNVRTTERIYVQILDRHKAAQNISRVFDTIG